MTLPYNRNFNKGRQSDQFLNEELHRIFTALKNINYKKEEQEGLEPESPLDGALWFDKSCNQLKFYDLASRSWKCVFSPLFQITNNITSLTTPSEPVLGQLWIYNGVLTYFDGSQWQPIRAIEQSSTQWSNAAFEDFQIVSPLNSDYLFCSANDTEYNTNYRQQAEDEWSSESGLEYVDEYPTYKAPDENLKKRYLVPNVNNDRFFIENNLDDNFTSVNDISIEYPESATAGKILTAVHLNPGKLKSIKKRLFKIDKLNPSIKISAYNTEFYGFRLDRFGGEFLVPSKSQESGDYIVSGDAVILNREAAQNYDYVMAVTYDFLWAKANGALYKHSNDEPQSSFYIANRKSDTISVHANGVMLEEADYDLDASTNTVTISEDAEGLDIDVWSPISKQHGYIRETQLDGTGIIRLHKQVSEPLVFVGGILLDPDEIKNYNTHNDKQVIYIPKDMAEIDDLHNLPWCVVDLFDIDGLTEESSGGALDSSSLDVSSITTVSENSTVNLEDGTLTKSGDYTDVTGRRVYTYILNSGHTEPDGDNIYIRYDKNKVNENSRFLLFINGLMACTDTILPLEKYSEGDYFIGLRDDINGTLILNKEEIDAGDRYTLIIDNKGIVYSHLDLEPAFNMGLISDGLVYADGRLLIENRDFATYDSEERESMKQPENGETLFFINNETTSDGGEVLQSGYWASYNSYSYKWEKKPEDEATKLSFMRTGYTRYARMLKVDDDIALKLYPEGIESDIDIRIYAFRFANSISGTVSIGEGQYFGDEVIDEYTYPVIKLGTKYSYGSDTLNLYLNGVKLIAGQDYKEMEDTSKVILLVESFNSEKDKVAYMIEPVETGELRGFQTIVMDRDNVIGPNIYCLDKDTDISLYPGRLTVYVNGLRLSNNEWLLIDNERIMLRFSDFLARGSSSNYPITSHINKKGYQYEVANRYPDYIIVEIRKDYDRKEQSLIYDGSKDNGIISIEEKELPPELLDTKDEVLFYLNGQFSGLTRTNNDYYLDKAKNAVIIKNREFLNVLRKEDRLAELLSNKAQLEDWRRRTGKQEYEPNKKSKLTLVWR